MMAELPKTGFTKRAVGKQVGQEHAFLYEKRREPEREEGINMARAVQVGDGSSVQYELEEYPLGDTLVISGNGRDTQSKTKILRLVTTPVEGYELLRKLKSDPLVRGVPIIVLTR